MVRSTHHVVPISEKPLDTATVRALAEAIGRTPYEIRQGFVTGLIPQSLETLQDPEAADRMAAIIQGCGVACAVVSTDALAAHVEHRLVASSATRAPDALVFTAGDTELTARKGEIELLVQGKTAEDTADLGRQFLLVFLRDRPEHLLLDMKSFDYASLGLDDAMGFAPRFAKLVAALRALDPEAPFDSSLMRPQHRTDALDPRVKAEFAHLAHRGARAPTAAAPTAAAPTGPQTATAAPASDLPTKSPAAPTTSGALADEARARAFWGHPRKEVQAYLTRQGASADTARQLVAQGFAARHASIKQAGIRDLITGSATLLAGGVFALGWTSLNDLLGIWSEGSSRFIWFCGVVSVIGLGFLGRGVLRRFDTERIRGPVTGI